MFEHVGLMWNPDQLIRDFVVNVVAGLLTGLLIFFVALRWELFKSFIRRDRAAFRRLFGAGAVEHKKLFVTLDTIYDSRLLPQDSGKASAASPQPQGRFFKMFPDGHWTFINGPSGELLGYCSARGAAYLINSLANVKGVSIEPVSDTNVLEKWNGTYINLGSSYSNIKTDHIKHLPSNPWLKDDGGEFTLKDGTVITQGPGRDRGIIMKLQNPYFPDHALLVCAGLGEWGTSGSAWFLANKWRELSRRFGSHPFLISVRVSLQSDESAVEELARGEELWSWKIRSDFRKWLVSFRTVS